MCSVNMIDIRALTRSQTFERRKSDAMAIPRVHRHGALCPKCGSNWVNKDGHSRGKQLYKRYRRLRKHQEGAKHRFTDETKARAVKTRMEGMSVSATTHVMGASVTTVSKWGGKSGHRRPGV